MVAVAGVADAEGVSVVASAARWLTVAEQPGTDAAARLRVHANTVRYLRYRLARVRELVGLDPRRFEDLHALRIAIAIDGHDGAGIAPRP